MTKRERLWQMFKFLCFSASAGVLQLVSYELLALLCREAFLLDEATYYWWCYLPSIILSVVWNFTFNRKFTFKSANNVPKAMALVLLFYVIFTPLSTWWGNALVNVGWNDTLVLIFTMIINFVTEYIYDTFVVFKNNDKKNSDGEKDDLSNE